MPKPELNGAFFLSAIDRLRDPVRDTRWRVLIPSAIWGSTALDSPTNQSVDMGILDPNGGENFALHVKTCDIPGIETLHKEVNYMGFGSSYPTNSKISADLPFKTILNEDMAAYELINIWNQTCLNTGLLISEDGTQDRISEGSDASLGPDLGLGSHKQDPVAGNLVLRNSIVTVELYNWANGEVILTVVLHNAWPKKVSPLKLKYSEQADLVMFDFTLRCDRWSLKFPEHHDNIDGTNP
jgi:hypothetical protein